MRRICKDRELRREIFEFLRGFDLEVYSVGNLQFSIENNMENWSFITKEVKPKFKEDYPNLVMDLKAISEVLYINIRKV